MKTFRKSTVLVAAFLVVAALTLSACAPAAQPTVAPAPSVPAPTAMPQMAPTPQPTAMPTQAPNSMPAQAPTTGAGTKSTALRTALNNLLGEHVILAANATNAALGGRNDEFKAAADALDANSVALSKAIGSVYGTDAENAFLPLWRKHISFFVDYTQGVAANDKAKQDKAVNDLIGYTTDFGAFLNSANPNLPADTVASLVKDHVVGLKAVVDAQAAKDYAGAYTKQREAYQHMQTIADPLAGAIVKQFPDKFDGATDTKSGDLHTALNKLLQEHAYLAAAATNAALGGRNDEFKAAADALDGNSVDLSKAIGSVYGGDAEKAFLPLWRKHIGFFVDYTTGVATQDKAKQDKAVNDLIGYTRDFGAFLNSANPNLPADAVSDLVQKHVVGLKSVVDAQGTKDYAAAYTSLRDAAGHMQMIADPLSDAIVKQFPDKFR
ncbi:MAG: copper amine oxidase [Chloroflexi bacterium]|nr:copper amine oxidase [Chloroflexota bacterium]